MMRFLRNLFGSETKQTKRKGRRPASGRRLGLEGLESRDLMALAIGLPTLPPVQWVEPPAPAVVTVSVENNDLVIRGTDGPDNVQVSAPENGKYVVRITTNGQTQKSFWKVSGGDVFFYGNKGDDRFAGNNSALRVTAFGGLGNDYLLGSSAGDKLNGGDGNDEIRGAAGSDNLKGDGGDDKIYGFDGNDVIDGGAGYDQIFGELGNDTIAAGLDFAPNYVDGGAGNDVITGGHGQDELRGNAGDDTIDGGLGEDYLYGNEGHDILRAGDDYGYNYLDGGAGNDKLFGSNGGDTLFGNDGDDRLFGGAGNDKLQGGDGRDNCYGQEGDDTLNGGGNDEYEDRLYGGAGRDTFYAEPFLGDQGWMEWWPDDYDTPIVEVIDREMGERVFRL